MESTPLRQFEQLSCVDMWFRAIMQSSRTCEKKCENANRMTVNERRTGVIEIQKKGSPSLRLTAQGSQSLCPPAPTPQYWRTWTWAPTAPALADLTSRWRSQAKAMAAGRWGPATASPRLRWNLRKGRPAPPCRHWSDWSLRCRTVGHRRPAWRRCRSWMPSCAPSCRSIRR